MTAVGVGLVIRVDVGAGRADGLPQRLLVTGDKRVVLLAKRLGLRKKRMLDLLCTNN